MNPRIPDHRGVVRDPAARREWYLAAGDRCHVCWIPWWELAAHRYCLLGATPSMAFHPHHLVGGPGRSDEPANLLKLCALCHDAYHRGEIRWLGAKWPGLTPGMLVAVKREMQPEQSDPQRLLVLLGWADFPERWLECELPEEFKRERERWQSCGR